MGAGWGGRGLITTTVWSQQHWQESALGHVTTALLAVAVLVMRHGGTVGGRLIGVVWAGSSENGAVRGAPRRVGATPFGADRRNHRPRLGAVLLFAILGWSFEPP